MHARVEGTCARVAGIQNDSQSCSIRQGVDNGGADSVVGNDAVNVVVN